MPPYSLCCLGALSLVRFVLEPFTANARFDFTKMAEVVGIAMRLLDNVLDATRYPLEKIEVFSKLWRRVGLGFTGLGDAIAMLGMKYGDEDSVAFCDLFARTLRDESYKASIELAKEKGAAPGLIQKGFLGKKRIDPRLSLGAFITTLPSELQHGIRRFGLRNIGLNTAAPTGTISLTVGNNCSSGIEPIFEYEFTRNVRTGEGDETKPEVVRDYACLLWDQLHPGEPLPDYFITTAELDPYKGIDIQAAIQKYIDHSISKCVGKDSLVQTSEGLMYMHELVLHRDPDSFQSRETTILNKDGEEERSDSVYYNGVKPAKLITLANGIQVKATPDHKFWDGNAWVKVSELIVNQPLYLKTPTNYVWASEEKEQSKN